MTIGCLRIKRWGDPLYRYHGAAISWVSRRRIISLELHLERRRQDHLHSRQAWMR